MPTIEFLVIANHAEAREGLLYLSGACWSDVWRTIAPGGAPPITHFGVGVAVVVPWGETNRRHHLTVRIEDEDGKEITRVEGDLELGRPVGISPGSDQRAVVAMNADLVFPDPGGYRLLAEVGEDRRAVSFRVHDGPQPRA